MTTEHYQLAIFILGFILVVWFATDLFNWINKKKSRGVPNLRNIPPAPIQRYRTPPPTIETQYGRDLIHASIEIYKVLSPAAYSPDARAKQATDIAERLVAQVNEKCFEIDKQKQDDARKFDEKWVLDERVKEQVLSDDGKTRKSIITIKGDQK